MIKIKCEKCKEYFWVKPSRVKRGAKYCSRICADIGRRGMTWKLGPLSLEHKEKLSLAKLGKKRGPHTEQTKKKISMGNKGNRNSLGYKWTKEQRLGISGSKCYSWKGGKSFEPYPIIWNGVYKDEIRKRDNYTCQLCGTPQIECIRRLSVHHIDYNKFNLHPTNLISLCLKCHGKTEKKRKFWEDFFNLKMRSINNEEAVIVYSSLASII